MRALGFVHVFLLFFLACSQEKSPPVAASMNDPRAGFIKAFFNTPLKSKGGISGFWSVEPKDFAHYIESIYLKNYKPQPNEPSVAVIRENIKAARYFLRIDGLTCDELFFIDGGGFTASAGTLKQIERTQNKTAFSVIFIRRNGTGKKLREGAILTTSSGGPLVLEFTDRKFTFIRELKSPAALAEQYGKPVFATGLAEY